MIHYFCPKKVMEKCACGSNQEYEECCQPIHHHENAPTALALMKSRYCAYANGLAEYIVTTTHPKVRHEHDLKSITEWAKSNHWEKLEIISAEHGRVSDQRGIVEFKAYYTNENGQVQIHHERSTFEKIDHKWYYLSAEFNPSSTQITKKVLRNDPCPCGSGKKYKKCCES